MIKIRDEMRYMRSFIIFAILVFFTGNYVFAQEWIVPEEAKEVKCPFKFVPDSVKRGESLFLKNCQSCHGYPGKNNVAKINPPAEGSCNT